MNLSSKILLLLLTINIVCLSSSATPLYTSVSTTRPTLLTEMLRLQKQHGIHFVYDSALQLDKTYNGPDLSLMTLSKALKYLFHQSGIEYRQINNNIMLRLSAKPVQQTEIERHSP